MPGQTIYYEYRKKASAYNETLKSREKTAELLGVSVSSLAGYELGTTKIVPPDVVILMADLYNAPELKNLYCKRECPLGKNIPMAVEDRGLESVTVKMINELDDDLIRDIKKTLLRIADDGRITEDEKEDFCIINAKLEAIATQISALKIIAEKLRG